MPTALSTVLNRGKRRYNLKSLSSPSGPIGPIVTENLVLYLDAGNNASYPGSGTTWYDLVGNSNGILTNGPVFNTGNGGNIVFDGINDYVDFGNILNLTSNFTLSTTFNMVDTTLGVQTIIGKQEATCIH